MSYTTQQLLQKKFSATEVLQLTDRDGDGTGDTGVLDEAIDSATRLINSYLALRYNLPLDQAFVDQSALPDKAADIVRYLLMDNLATEEVKERYMAAMRWLKDIRRGDASLGEQDTQPTDTFRTQQGCSVSKHDWGAY